jgi:hypothetical protein
MANESTATAISTFINEIWEGAVLAARESTVVAPLVRNFSATGIADRYFSQYTGGTVGQISEYTDTTAQTFTPGTVTKLTPAMYAGMYYLTDRRVESDPYNVRADAANDLGQLMGNKVDTLLVGAFSSLTGGTVGTAGGTITWSNFLAAAAALRGKYGPQPYVCVMHPNQWYYLANTIAAGNTVTNAPALQDAVARQFFAANAYGIDIYLDANITAGTAAVAAMFSRDALALDVRRAFRIEPQRDASRGGGGWELIATMDFAYGVWRSTFGVQMIGTTTID